MLKVRKANVEETIVCPFDDEPHAEFKVLSCMDVDKRAEIFDLLQGGGMSTKAGLAFYSTIVKKALLGCSGLVGLDEKPIVLNGKGVTDEIIKQMSEIRLPGTGFDNLITWLGAEIWKRTALTDETKKNSDLPSSPVSEDSTKSQ